MKDYQGKIEWKDPASLVPYPMNAKAHPEAQIDKVAGSIAAFGFDQPIVVDEQGVILKGHARREASLKLGLKTVPVLVRTDLTESEKKASRLADNRTAESEWFPETLALELKALEEMDFDLSLTGFDLDELEGFGIGAGGDPPPEDPGPQIDRAAELQEKWGTARGQIWELPSESAPGKAHRVMCGDSTSAEDVGRLMGEKKADMVFTDPPYNVGKEYAGEDLNLKEFIDFHANWIIEMDKLIMPDTPIYVCFGAKWMFEFADILRRTIPKPRLLIWYKPDSHGVGGGDYFYNYEAVFYGSKSGSFSVRDYGGEARDVWIINKAKESDGGFEHSTVKPLGVPEAALKTSSKPSWAIYDPFLGSGTTLIAAEQLGRVCFGMEISEAYTAVVLERASGLGLEPKLIES